MRPSKFTTASRRRSTGPDDDTVITVLMRSMRDRHTSCEVCGVTINGERGVHWSVHHRVPRGMGGTTSAAVNAVPSLLVVCGSATTGCHQRIESRRAEARVNGWLVARGLDPETTPVLIDNGSRWVYLGSNGKYHDNPPVGA